MSPPAGRASTPPESQAARDFDWVLRSFVRTTSGVRSAIVVTADGLVLSTSRTDVPDAGQGDDRLAAVISGIAGLANSAGTMLGLADFEQMIIEMEHGMLFVSLAGRGLCLGVVTNVDCDMRVIGYEMTMMVRHVGAAMTPALISELRGNSGAPRDRPRGR